MTIGERIKASGGYTSGFDYLRVILAVLVMYGHAFLVTGQTSTATGLGGFLWSVRGHLILPMFFSLSGFLVAASLLRVVKLSTFLTLRGLRILPALLVEVLISAFVLGPLLTTESLGSYFAAPELHSYMLNIFGWPHYLLPGVFKSNPVQMVNASLWTVPYEAECYLILAALGFIGLTRKPSVFALAGLVLLVGLEAGALLGHDVLDTGVSRGTFAGRQLVLSFLAGVALYLNRDVLPYSRPVFILACALTVATVSIHSLAYVAIVPAAYVTSYLGLLTPRKLPLIFTGDYSYGIYLYAAPIQQTIRTFFPDASAQVNFAGSLVLVVAVAVFSWHVVEKPFMKIKHVLLSSKRGVLKSQPRDAMISPDKTDPVIAQEPAASM